MRALFLSQPQTFELGQTEPPDLPEGWVRVRVCHVGICRSDVHYYIEGRIGDQVVAYPHVVGHECSGEVIEGGDFAPGTPVYVEPALSCGACDQCRIGRENTCRNLKFFAAPGQAPGCLQEQIVVPPENVTPLPGELDIEEAVLLEPLCIGVYAAQQSRIQKAGTATVLGAGPIGLSVQLALTEYELAAVYVTDPVAERRQAANALGAAATFDPKPVEEGAHKTVFAATESGVDVAFECAGTQEAIDDAVNLLKPGGTLMLLGIPAGVERIKFNPSICRRRELTIINIRRQNRTINRALALLQRRRDFANTLITHRFTLDHAKQAFDLVHEHRDGVLKAVITM